MIGFNISVLGEDYGFLENTIYANTFSEKEFEIISEISCGNLTAKTYKNQNIGLEILSKQKLVGKNTYEIVNTATNISDKAIVLTHISSGVLRGICSKGSWLDDGRITIHLCKCCWQGEYQWNSFGIKEGQIYNPSTHSNNSHITINSSGSWSTGKYYPLAIIEDKVDNRCYYVEIISSTSWEIEIGNLSVELSDGELYIEANASSENCDCWSYTLNPMESFTAKSILIGKCDGAFGDAIKKIYDYKRNNSLVAYENNIIPVFYNCYMNALWSYPFAEDLLPIIDKAAELGVEYFCIDAGWFCGYAEKNGMGSWRVNEEIFGDYGLFGIFSYIKKKGMRAGIWFEFEACSAGSELYESEFLLKRYNKIIGGSRAFVDFTNADVRNYLYDVVERLYKIGLEMIKNDYNQTVGIGVDREGLCLSEGLRKNAEAFLSFIDEMHKRCPNLIIENCGSGAMRSDFDTLRHFELQSVSDQEIYTNTPSIQSGALACIPPEKCGVWATPYPRRYNDRMNKMTPTDIDSMRAAAGDGEETVFNMVTSMLGVIYLSGRIEIADEYNTKLMLEAINLYKQIRNELSSCYPVWFNGFPMLNQTGIFLTALENPQKSRLYLALWRINGASDTLCVSLGDAYKNAKIKYIYPKSFDNEIVIKNGNLKAILKNNITARFLVIE